MVFRAPRTNPKFTVEIPKMFSLAFHSQAAILFNIFYVGAIFLDKIIVWFYQGLASGQLLLVTGPYTVGAFLGLIPMFSVAILVYFTKRTKSLVDERYTGTFAEIQKRILDYKAIYWASIRMMLIIALAISALTVAISFYFISDQEIRKVLVTTCIGSILFSVVVFNSIVLPIFGKTGISTLAVLVVIFFEVLSIPFVPIDVWYASMGFLSGALAGFLISISFTVSLFAHFEHNMFRYLLHSD